MPRLRRTHPGQPGYTRRRRGKGWQYLDRTGAAVRDPETVERINGLVIPPAWQDVWITPYPNGHLQAVGTDAAGRRQYLYHPYWQESRHRAKFERVIDFGKQLPSARRTVDQHLALPGMPRERALATAFRLLDRGHFRIGGEVYAETNGSFGLATLRREHVRRERNQLVFDYTAKSGLHRIERIEDPELLDAVGTMRLRRGGGDELLVFRDGRHWRHIGSADINAYLKDVLSENMSAKDFRTWHGTVLASVALAQLATARDPRRKPSKTATAKAVRTAVVATSQLLGNTPAVARSSYIDPRVISAYEQDQTVSTAVTRALRTLAADLPDLTDAEQVGLVLSRVAAVPAVEKAVLTLLQS
ncbi:DNA topoisomerase IB [Nakamurella endophytica]|uniref:DNA topoisomerase n=1 Tax=Nakamurella endophytica TaxID=1748367 RepID=A0A917T262_9ACTN|nr:DNA topoisomerase IB [Nakamurella endophytica]GGM07711.1 DNA topoisomerase [Nakamurella endophytica]